MNCELYRMAEQLEVSGKIGTGFEHYLEIYSNYFLPIRNKHLRILEIGIQKGKSLQLWNEFFLKLDLFGIDINSDCKQFETPNTRIFIGDQEDATFLKYFLDESGGNFDIIIDDGGHTMQQQINSFSVLFNALKPGGIYIIEDLHTSYWPQFNGGLDRTDTTIALLKRNIDLLNYHSVGTAYISPVYSIHFYDGLAFIFKR